MKTMNVPSDIRSHISSYMTNCGHIPRLLDLSIDDLIGQLEDMNLDPLLTIREAAYWDIDRNVPEDIGMNELLAMMEEEGHNVREFMWEVVDRERHIMRYRRSLMTGIPGVIVRALEGNRWKLYMKDYVDEIVIVIYARDIDDEGLLHMGFSKIPIGSSPNHSFIYEMAFVDDDRYVIEQLPNILPPYSEVYSGDEPEGYYLNIYESKL